MREGPDTFRWPPTSGSAWSRRFLDRVFPIPEALYHVSAETCVLVLAPFYGIISTVREPLSLYRRHGRNGWWSMSFEARLELASRFFDHYAAVALKHCEALGVAVDPAVWKRNSWWFNLQAATRELSAMLPDQGRFVLVDDGAWGMSQWGAREAIPFLERNGEYQGAPADDGEAIAELERLRDSGATHVVFAAASWLEHYRALAEYLYRRFRCVLKNERLAVFDLVRVYGAGG
jgi:hypothetical protein